MESCPLLNQRVDLIIIHLYATHSTHMTSIMFVFGKRAISLSEFNIDKLCVFEDTKSGWVGNGGIVQYRFGYTHDLPNDSHANAPLYFNIEFAKLTGTTVHPALFGMPHHDYPVYGGAQIVGPDVQTSLEDVVAKIAVKLGINVTQTELESHTTQVFSTRLGQFLPKETSTLDSLLLMEFNGILIQPRFIKVDSDFVCKCRIVLACIN